jgi:hypothetical protein
VKFHVSKTAKVQLPTHPILCYPQNSTAKLLQFDLLPNTYKHINISQSNARAIPQKNQNNATVKSKENTKRDGVDKRERGIEGSGKAPSTVCY